MITAVVCVVAAGCAIWIIEDLLNAHEMADIG